MDLLSTIITVKPVLLGAMFGAKPITLKVEKTGIEVIQGHQEFTILYEDLGDQVSLEKGMIFDDDSPLHLTKYEDFLYLRVSELLSQEFFNQHLKKMIG